MGEGSGKKRVGTVAAPLGGREGSRGEGDASCAMAAAWGTGWQLQPPHARFPPSLMPGGAAGPGGHMGAEAEGQQYGPVSGNAPSLPTPSLFLTGNQLVLL